MRQRISFVIPAKDEADSIKPLYQEIVLVVKKTKHDYEIIFIDDGSIDNTLTEIQKLRKRDKRVKIIKHRGNWGKSVSLQNGFNQARGDIVFTLDADLQDNPKEVPKFLDKLEKGYDLVSGWKKVRHDPLSKTFPSKIGNFVTRLFTRVPVHDLNCGFKAYRAQVVKSLNLYGELYKYIPVLAQKQNFKVGEVVVSHRPRKFGKSKFGWSRNVKGFLDMLTVIFLTGYLRRPAHFFGTAGIIFTSMGFLIGLYITYLRLATGSIQNRHPLLFLGMLLIIIGIQLISTGLLAEIIIYSKEKVDYSGFIEEVFE